MANIGTGKYHAGWVNRIVWSAPGNSSIKIKLYYNDNSDEKDPPEYVPGHYGDLGYTIDGLDQVKKGKIFIRSIMYWTNDFSLNGVENYLNVLDRPLKVSVSD